MNRLTIIGLIIVVILVVVALFAPWIATHDIAATNLSMRYLPPSAEHWFGTDSTGRDIFSRVLFGARISLKVGIVVVAVSSVIGTLLGAVAGYYGGWVIVSFPVTSSTCFWRFRVCCWQSRWSRSSAPV
jgi:peptide/nickel transport system permease protein